MSSSVGINTDVRVPRKRRPWKPIAAILVGGLAILPALSLPSYFQEIQRARKHQASFGSKLLSTPCGQIEYATYGQGQPALVVHGVTGGYDQGITNGRMNIGEGFQIIAPSRFGYQNTPLPQDASPAAQADAFACLLDALNLSRIPVVGISAGAPSSVQFALRHSDRVSALVLLAPGLYTPEPATDVQSVAFPFMLASILKWDYPLWVAMKVSPQLVLSTMGVPPVIQNQLSKEKQVEFMNWMLPFDTRISGVMNDGKIAANIGTEPYPLEKITAPTLVISAKDDLWKTYSAATYTASTIPNAKFVGFETGGHLLNGQEDQVRTTIRAFLQQNQ
jgi:pimeloyl-ACP methyl ester carboxylesterase